MPSDFWRTPWISRIFQYKYLVDTNSGCLKILFTKRPAICWGGNMAGLEGLEGLLDAHAGWCWLANMLILQVENIEISHCHLCHPSLPSLRLWHYRRWRRRCHWCCCRRWRRRRWYHGRGLRSYAARLCYGRLWRRLPERCCGWLVMLSGIKRYFLGKSKSRKYAVKLYLCHWRPLCDHVHQYIYIFFIYVDVYCLAPCYHSCQETTKTFEAGYRWKAPLNQPKQMERREFALLLGRWVSACWYDTSHLPKSKLIQLFFVPVIDSKIQKRVCKGYVKGMYLSYLMNL